MPETITVIVPTYNEEDNVRQCLASLRWADDIFVVDSYSTDKTVELAREFTDHIVQHEYVNSATQKNWALGFVHTDWVMVCDADERVSPELAARVRDILARGTDYDGFYIRRRTVFFGKLIRHCGWHKDYLVRLWRTGKGRYEDLEVHADVVVDGRVGTIREPFYHNTYRDLAHYLEKFRRYTTLAANDLYKRGRRPTWANLALRPLWRFFRMFVLRHGFLDGKHGLVLCTLAAFSVFMKYAKLWERYRLEAQSGSEPAPQERDKARELVEELTEL